MGKPNKAITKCCPHCEMQIAVACKICPGCKRVLISNNKKGVTTSSSSSYSEPSGSRRRTERVKREKPKFYDASQFEKKKQKRRRVETSTDFNRGRPPSQSQALKKKVKKRVKTKDEIADEDEPVISLNPEKTKQLSIVLAELNMKMLSTSWSI